LLGSVTTAAVAALIGIGVPAVALSSNTGTSAGTNMRSGGYPPPGGIYTGFTNCPVKNALMHETASSVSDPAAQGVSLAACTAGNAVSGALKIGNITTAVTQRVNVQFGFSAVPNAAPGGENTGGLSPPQTVLPPPAGLSAILATRPDLVPESLTTALGCPSSNATVESLCQQAQSHGGMFNQVFALAQEAGPITNFGLVNWTQRAKFQLINPLLGRNCYIGSDENPVVLNPQLSIDPGGQLLVKPDPNPARHPDTEVLDITAATASDNTFSAPAVSGCGPGGLANVPVDEAIDASAGLPAAPGTNSLSLTGTFQIAVCFAGEDSSLSQPQDNAAILLSAFNASTSAAKPAGSHISASQLRSLFKLK